MKLKKQAKSRVILFSSILLISFGIFNLSTNIYGEEQDSAVASDVEPKTFERFYQDLVEQLLTTAMPILGGAISIVLQYGRSKGLQISKDAEEYIIGATQSIVKNQGRLFFNKVYEHKELLGAWGLGQLDGEDRKTLKDKLKELQTESRNQALKDLESEINSSKFKKTARKFIGDNLNTLIDRAFTKEQSDKAERAKNLLRELSSLAVDSALLYHDKKTLSKEDKDKIINSGIDILAKNFDFESIVLDVSNAKMHLEAALTNKINS